MRLDNWVHCVKNEGFRHENDLVSTRSRRFAENAVGQVKAIKDNCITVWLIGSNEIWDLLLDAVHVIDITKTGDTYTHKICNVCHCLFSVRKFAKNQTNSKGEAVRRPSCMQCRTDIDKRAPKSQQAKQLEKRRPETGAAFRCPICDKRSIVGVTAKIVADHNHHTGDIRDFICDSCNTGLGRFKNGENYLHNAIKYLEERDNEE